MPHVMSVPTKRIEIIPDNCVGCQLCMLACSRVKFGEFNPEKAFVRIEVDSSRPAGYWRAEFTEQCDVCGYCASFCAYDAITLEVRRHEPREVAASP